MKINAHKCAFAAASAISISYLIFAALMVFIPEQVMHFIMSAHFLLPGSLPSLFQISIMNAVQGLLAHFIFVYAIVYLAGCIYNMMENK